MKRWTSEDEDYLKHNYKNMTNKELSKSLGRSVESITKKKNKLGLRKVKKHPPITSGDEFGDWVVKSFSHVDKKGNSYYQCQCSCGDIKNIRGSELKSGSSTSCGGSKHFDLTNSVFGELTVLRHSHIDSNGKSYYQCMCSCGHINTVRGDSLTGGFTSSCGKREHSDLTGLSFYNWEVLSISYTDKHNNTYYICRCSCGTIKDVRGNHLVSGMSTSCGCSKEYKGEVRIRQYFESITDFVYKEQKEYKGLFYKHNNSRLISDGAVYNSSGDLVFMIEYDGIQHYEYTPFFHRSQKDFYEQVERDRLKDEYCSKNNIEMIRIAYWDYDNIESILDSYIK